MSVKFYWLLKKLVLWLHKQKYVNCQPLIALPNDPNDPISMSPGHSLNGTPLTSFPGTNFTNTTMNSLSKLQWVQHFNQQLWKRWSSWLPKQLTVIQQMVQQETRPPAQHTCPAVWRQLTLHVLVISNHQWDIPRFRWKCKSNNSDN